MAFKPDEHLRTLKGQQYLDVKWRLAWLREEYPDARITTELAHLDTEKKIAVFKAEVELPSGGSATGYGSETEQDFPLGWVEKAETKAVGRALAALGFGTQFALELDEGDRVVDSPVARRPEKASLKVVPADRAEGLRTEVSAGLAADKDAAAKLPKSTDEMTADELEKTLAWLRNRAKRQA